MSARRPAFVVELDPVAGARGRLRGRAELVASGEVVHFRSVKQLVGFMVAVLRRPPDADARRRELPHDRS
jgi:hypothetical protein